MCGIYGLIHINSQIDMDYVIKQRDKLSHRGPNDSGVWLNSNKSIALAHRRLSIVDLSSLGHQPMLNHSESVVIVFNGEIYNFIAIRHELIAAGFAFKSNTDTEVILYAWQHWGQACLHKFNGMFAFAIYDKQQKKVFFARDRVGKKPLYYAMKQGRFEFASELKAITHDKQLNLQALDYYLGLGYVPQDLCLFEGVKKLPPAHWAELDLESFSLKVERYWELPANKSEGETSKSYLVDQVESILLDATKIRMEADVPVGVLLSGGLDSSLVAAAATRASAKRIQTFTIGISGSKLDETSYADIVAKHIGSEHHVLDMADTGLDVLAEFAPFVDEPIADSSILPTYLVSKLTKNHVSVALGGDGGDELFGGYTHYAACLNDQRLTQYVPKLLLQSTAYLASFLPAGIHGRNKLTSLANGGLEQMVWGTAFFDQRLRKNLLNEDNAHDLANQSLQSPEAFLHGLYLMGKDPVDALTRMDFNSILPDDFMVKVDRASMASSLEMRSPLLDYRLIEFAFSAIPSNDKVYNGETRIIQKELAKKWLPAQLDIHRKQGFSIPLDDWLRKMNDEWHMSWIHNLPDVINKAYAQTLVDGLRKHRTNGSRIFALIMLSIACNN